MATLAGRSALVTGSVDGLGYAIAAALAGEGCNVLLTNSSKRGGEGERADALAEAHSVIAGYTPADLSRPDAIESLVSAAEQRFGGLDILVNSAVARGERGPVEAFDPRAWEAALAINLTAPFHLIRLLLPKMRARRFGRIVNIASIYGLFGAVHRVDYVSSKTALVGLTKAVALECIGEDITCNAICPSLVLTPPSERGIEALREATGLTRREAERRYLSTRQTTDRFVETVPAVVTFLCGPGGRDITGTAIPVDLGWSAG